MPFSKRFGFYTSATTSQRLIEMNKSARRGTSASSEEEKHFQDHSKRLKREKSPEVHTALTTIYQQKTLQGAHFDGQTSFCLASELLLQTQAVFTNLNKDLLASQNESQSDLLEQINIAIHDFRQTVSGEMNGQTSVGQLNGRLKSQTFDKFVNVYKLVHELVDYFEKKNADHLNKDSGFKIKEFLNEASYSILDISKLLETQCGIRFGSKDCPNPKCGLRFIRYKPKNNWDEIGPYLTKAKFILNSYIDWENSKIRRCYDRAQQTTVPASVFLRTHNMKAVNSDKKRKFPTDSIAETQTSSSEDSDSGEIIKPFITARRTLFTFSPPTSHEPMDMETDN